MKILCLHNYYQWSGGEDRVFESEVGLLRAQGHEVLTYIRHNRDVDRLGKVVTALKTWWNPRTYRELSALLRQHRPHVVHATNLFPLISPSAYAAARACGVPVVQSLHNFRLLCPDSTFFRQGRLCQDCLGKPLAWPGIWHGCYRGSRLGTAVVAGMQSWHRLLGTWRSQVARMLAPSEYVRRQFEGSGQAYAPLRVKPNFVSHDAGPGDGEGDFLLFVGRLVPEKGILTLLSALSESRLALKIVGQGPLEGQVRDWVASRENCQFLGFQSPSALPALMQKARCLVVPSLLPETFGLVAAEAFSCGTPVLASHLGALPEMVQEGVNGALVAPGDVLAWRQRLESSDQLVALRSGARETYLNRYSAEANYRQLLSIYGEVA